MIPKEAIDDLLSKADIVQTISPFVKLKQAGNNFLGLCPFHTEKTHSFSVSPNKQFYHCFGCGAHGNALSFVMNHQNLSFRDAFDLVASTVGVPQSSHYTNPVAVPADDAEAGYLSIYSKAQKYYQDSLTNHPEAYHYLLSRGLNSETIARFQLGFAPNEWQGLVKKFKNAELPKVIDAGLIGAKSDKHYDRMRDRITFPIFDKHNRIIAFGGRQVSDAPDSPKYLNSSTTQFFTKGRHLYGMPKAIQAIRTTDEAIVVEGYMDVVALAQYGIENVVATLGTAMTIHHAQQLINIAHRLVFCFDGDPAGHAAANKTMITILGELTDTVEVYFALLPTPEDPDSLVKKKGKQAFEKFISKAKPLSSIMMDWLKQNRNLTNPEGCAAFMHLANELISKVKNAPIYAQMLKAKAEKLARINATSRLKDISDEALVTALISRLDALPTPLREKVTAALFARCK